MTELPGNRETAYRVFAAEFDDATVTYQESDEERAPNYVITPTGARVNRLFAVGVLTEVESVNEDVLRARVVDPTGAFVVYAGQYQPDEMAALERLEPPAFVAVTGKANTFSPDDSDRVYTSIRPESINVVDAETRDRWVVRTAEHTVDRVGTVAAAADLDASGDALRAELEARDVPVRAASGAALALEHYGTTPAYLAAVHDLALDAARVVAGDVDEVAGDTPAVDDVGDGAHSYADLAADLGDAGPTARSTSGAADLDAADATDSTDATEPDASAEPATSADDEPAEADETADAEAAEPDEATEAETADEPADAAAEAEPTDDTATDDAATADDTDEVSADATDAADDGEAASEEDEGVGDFEPGDIGSEASAATDEMYEFDEDEREEIEEEYGTEFSSGNEVPEPEESELDAPDPEPDADAADESAEADAAAAADDTEAADDAGEVADDTGDAEEAADDAADADDDEDEMADVDLDVFVMDAMREMDDGDGVDRDELVDHVVDETGADADEVDDAVQEALMGGQCYEPDDGVLKPI